MENKSIETAPVEYCVATIELKKTIESGFIVLGERLAKIKAAEMWQSQWSSFPEYLMEMNINESTASKMISVYKTYVEKFSIDENLLISCGWDKLYSARELVEGATTKKEVLDIVQKITTLKRDDTRELIREHRNGDCEHDWYEVHLRVCKECGKREKING